MFCFCRKVYASSLPCIIMKAQQGKGGVTWVDGTKNTQKPITKEEIDALIKELDRHLKMKKDLKEERE